MKKEISLGELIKKLDETGWKAGIIGLEAMHKILEERQAWLFGGDADQVHQASQMAPMLLKQDETLIALRQMAKERGISIE